MKLYNISKGQLVVLWIVGVISAIVLFFSSIAYETGIYFLISVVIIGFLAFYTIGWRSAKNIADFDNVGDGIWKKFLRLIRKVPKKVYIWLAIIFVVISIINLYPIFDTNTNMVNENSTVKDTIYSVNLGLDKVDEPNNSLLFTPSRAMRLGPVVNNDFGYSYYSPAKTEGEFVKMVFTVTNTGTNSRSFRLSKIKYIDEKGRAFSPIRVFNCDNTVDEGKIYGSYSNVFLKPGIPCRYAVMFETASDSENYQIKVDYTTFISPFDF